MKIAITDSEELKWVEEQKEKIKDVIVSIFGKHGRTLIKIDNNKHWRVSGLYENITLVSGHCHKGGVDIWAEEIADVLGIKKEIYPAEVEQWKDENYHHIECHNVPRLVPLKGYRSRNIQIAEACDILYCIVPYVEHPKSYDEHISFGVYQFLPTPEKEIHTENYFCFYCNKWGHPTNGGCWTMRETKKLGKETHLVVIE